MGWADKQNKQMMMVDGERESKTTNEAEDHENQEDEFVRINHIGFGVVCGEDGKKFSTRDGKVKLNKNYYYFDHISSHLPSHILSFYRRSSW